MEGDCGGDNNGGWDEEEWHPPTEAEMKVIQARRERSDKVSKIMGQYLLKGHRMLDSVCPTCSCILLRLLPSNSLHCVSCVDLDSEIKKDDPALNSAAASSTVTEEQHRDKDSTANATSSERDHRCYSYSTASYTTISTSFKRTQSNTTNSSSASISSFHLGAPKTKLALKQEVSEVEEHATGSAVRAEPENLSRSQLTAVHDIPAAANSNKADLAAPMSKHNVEEPTTSMHNPVSAVSIGEESFHLGDEIRRVSRVDSIDNFSEMSKIALQTTISNLTLQLQKVNRCLSNFDDVDPVFGFSSSYFELLNVVSKLSQSLSSAAEAYNRLGEI